MQELGLGKLIESPQSRDAIHIAVAPVVADERLAPGQPIGFVEGSTVRVAASALPPIGIVDPFLTKMVYPGQEFWMFLYPNTITSLRHEWTHPAFEYNGPSDLKAEAEKYLREFADEHHVPYDEMITEIRLQGFYVEQGSTSLSAISYDELLRERVISSLELVTGRKIERDDSVFSCSC